MVRLIRPAQPLSAAFRDELVKALEHVLSLGGGGFQERRNRGSDNGFANVPAPFALFVHQLDQLDGHEIGSLGLVHLQSANSCHPYLEPGGPPAAFDRAGGGPYLGPIGVLSRKTRVCEGVAMRTRTGAFRIGFREGWSDWQKDRASAAAWAGQAGFEMIDLGAVSPDIVKSV